MGGYIGIGDFGNVDLENDLLVNTSQDTSLLSSLGGSVDSSTEPVVDSTLAQISDIFSSLGGIATDLIPAIEGPTQLHPGATYLTPQGQVVNTPSNLGGLSFSPTILFMVIGLILLAILWSRR